MSILGRATAHPRRITRVKCIIILLLLLLFVAPARTKRSLLSKSSTGGDNRRCYGVINVEKFFFRWQARTCCSTTQTHTRARRAARTRAACYTGGGLRLPNNSVSTVREDYTELRAPSTSPTTSCVLIPLIHAHSHTPPKTAILLLLYSVSDDCRSDNNNIIIIYNNIYNNNNNKV